MVEATLKLTMSTTTNVALVIILKDSLNLSNHILLTANKWKVTESESSKVKPHY